MYTYKMPTITQSEAKRMGIPKRTLQTILISRAHSLAESKQWLKDNNYANSYYRVTKNFRRFMQTPPIQGAKYESKILPNNVELVYQYY